MRSKSHNNITGRDGSIQKVVLFWKEQRDEFDQNPEYEATVTSGRYVLKPLYSENSYPKTVGYDVTFVPKGKKWSQTPYVKLFDVPPMPLDKAKALANKHWRD
jgi:hypothetical protein